MSAIRSYTDLFLKYSDTFLVDEDNSAANTLLRIADTAYPDKKYVNITFQVTEGCTLACKYCYQHDKTPKHMTFDDAKKIIDRLFIDLPERYYAITVDFIGGEPLMEPELIRKAADYIEYQCIMHYPDVPWGKFLEFNICTNGTEWDKPGVKDLIKHLLPRLSFSVSIDGNKELHDSARVHYDGRGSYDEAIHAATEFEEMVKDKLGSKMTIAPSNVWYTAAALKHYLDSGTKIIHANCVYEEGWKIEDAQLYYKELKKVADHMIENEYYRTSYVSIFALTKYMPKDPSDDEAWCGGNGRMLSIGPDGVYYPCLRYMPSSVGQNRDDYITLGDIETGLDLSLCDEMQKVTRSIYSDEECFNCPICSGCGDCVAYRWERFGTIEKKTKFHCDMQRAQSLAATYYWNKIFLKENIPEYYKMNCPDDWALRIIDKEELNMLHTLVDEAKLKAEK